MYVVCGIDEAGRGPLAGPVTAAAVVLSPDFPFHILDDSKALPEKKRITAAETIMNESLDFAVGWAWPGEIDSINIHNASLLAMKRAFENISVRVEMVYVDGRFPPDISAPCRAVVKGDIKIREIQAASILAKTVRDRWMMRYSWIDGRYGFEKHKGYPTKAHRQMCLEYGLSPIHRKSFRILP